LKGREIAREGEGDTEKEKKKRDKNISLIIENS
jgi:hypothetical protein